MISCIITCYNRAELIQRAIHSILTQTEKNWELIIVDDGSTDNSVDVIKSFVHQDKRISYYVIPHNGTPGAVKDYGIQRATNELVCILDSDDYLAPTAFEEVLNNISDNDVIYTDSVYFEDDQRDMLGSHASLVYSMEEMLNHCSIQHLVVYKKTLYDSVGGFKFRFKYCANYDLYLRFSEVAKVKHLQKPLYYYNWNGDYSSILNDHYDLHIQYGNLARYSAYIRRGLIPPADVINNLPII